MPTPADIIVTNASAISLTIQTQTIVAGGSYTVPFANIVAWSKDPFLQVYVYTNQVYLTVLGVVYRNQAALNLLQQLAAGTVVFAS